jgi:hypothetical protein
MRTLLLVVPLLALGACTTSHSITLADGSQGQRISCDGAMLNMADCYQKAGEVCPRGYDTMVANGEAIPFAVSSGSFAGNRYAASGGFTSTAGSIVTRSLIVRCH